MSDNMFLAKSSNNGMRETIMSHTERLLEEYERLETLYPFLKKNEKLWEMLKVVCIYHDFGKMNQKFQDRIKNNNRGLLEGEIHHAVLSMGCLNLDKMEDFFGEDSVEEVYKAILFHHHRKDLIPPNKSLIFDEIEKMEEDYFDFVEEVKRRREEFPKLFEGFSKYGTGFYAEDEKELVFEDFYLAAYTNDILSKEEVKSQKAITYIFLKGLLNRIDYAASAGVPVEQQNDFLENGLSEFMMNLNTERLKSGKERADWNELQRYMMAHSEENVIVVAQTGMGKTEAALWWIGNHKGIFTLPLKTAINSIYERIKNKILKNEKIENRLGLLHGESFEYYVKLNKDKKFQEGLFDVQDYYTKTKQLSLPLTITTLDQIFLFVFRYIGYEERLATMAYSKVVVDEIQMYGSDLTAFLVVGLEMIWKMGGKFAILTATFPGFIKDLMKERGIKFEEPIATFVDKENIRHALIRKYEAIKTDFIFEEYKKDKKKRILVICNTVKQCQKIYRELAGLMKEEADKLHMLHAKFIRKDRERLEKEILEFTLEDMMSSGIWITSSIAEASLDIDFDLLITELSDINSLFQRLGRCFRRRFWLGEGYNCVVFDGGDGYCSGVGEKLAISEEVFLMSKDELKDRIKLDEILLLDEELKLEIIEKLYSTENMKNKAPKYLGNVRKNMEIPNLFSPNEKDRKEATQKFRNIISYTVIPSPIFMKYEEEIRGLEEKLRRDDLPFEEKVLIRQKIRRFTIDINFWDYNGGQDNGENITLSRWEMIPVMNCHYNSEIGFERIVHDGEGVIW